MTAWRTPSAPCEAPIVLLVSRDEKMSAAWEFIFKQKGCCVIHEQTPRHALQAARMLLPALAILDLDLPKAERAALCRELRPLLRKALVLLAHVSSAEEAAEYYRAGADERLSPAISPMALLSKSLAWLAR